MNLANTLKTAIQNYLEADKRRSLSTLARKSGVSYATVRRLAQGEIKEPQLDNVLQICAIIMPFEQTIELLDSYNPDIAEWLRSKRRNHYEFSPLQDSFSFETPDVFIIAHAATKNGLREEIVIERFGRYGVERLQLLEEGGLIERSKDCFKTKHVNFVDPNPSSVLKRMALCLEQFDLDKLDSGAFFRYYTGEVSAQQKRDILAAIRDADTKIAEIFNREDADQDEVMFVGKFGNFF